MEYVNEIDGKPDNLIKLMNVGLSYNKKVLSNVNFTLK